MKKIITICVLASMCLFVVPNSSEATYLEGTVRFTDSGEEFGEGIPIPGGEEGAARFRHFVELAYSAESPLDDAKRIVARKLIDELVELHAQLAQLRS